MFDTAMTDELLATTRGPSPTRLRPPGRARGDPRLHRPRATGADGHRHAVVALGGGDRAGDEGRAGRGLPRRLPELPGERPRRRTRRPDTCTRAPSSSPPPSSTCRCSSSRASSGGSTARRSSSPRRRSAPSSRRRGASSSPSGRAASARCGRPRTSGTNPRRRGSSASPTPSRRWRCSQWRTPSGPTSSGRRGRRPDGHVLGVVGDGAVNGPVPPLLRPRSSDECAPVPWDARLHRTASAVAATRRQRPGSASPPRPTTGTVGASPPRCAPSTPRRAAATSPWYRSRPRSARGPPRPRSRRPDP
jgi:hypothetical protein